jgi:hypothetical protein
LTYFYREDDKLASLLLELHRLDPHNRDKKVQEWIETLKLAS